LNLAEEMKLEDLRRVLGAQLCDDMVVEFPSLLVLYASLQDATSLNPEELLAFWSRNAHHVPAWACAARIFCLIQPSSAAAERAFSVWRTSVDDQQVVTLEDRQKLTMQIKFSNTISPGE
jgi:hypothetical protein